jgi:hypothetical protein
VRFEEAQRMFREEKIRELAAEEDGLRFLKLRSLSRRDYLESLFSRAGSTPRTSGGRNLFREAYETNAISDAVIDSFIRQVYAEERETRRQREPALVDQLYRYLFSVS